MRKHILTITFLLLSLPAYVSAKNRTPKEALVGLRDFGVIVKYDQADGLPEAMRPTVLQMLQDRARDTLRLAEVPLLQSPDEADMTGRPRLVFTLTLNKQSTTAPAIYVDTRLYERVRLWRDQAKEMELATWVAGGVGGPKVTNQMLFDVFDGQLNWFVKDYREANPNATDTVSRTPDPPSQLIDNANSLQGLSGTRLFIWSGPSYSVDARTEALLKKLQSEAENKFKQAGIPILRYINESEKAGRPILYVSIKLIQKPLQAPTIFVESEFSQRVRPVRDPQKVIDAVTWESRASDNQPITDEAVQRVVNSQLDEFIKAYNAANTQLSSAPK